LWHLRRAEPWSASVDSRYNGLESCDAQQSRSRAEPEQKRPGHATGEYPDDGRGRTDPPALLALLALALPTRRALRSRPIEAISIGE
jgi:hypothetical protein